MTRATETEADGSKLRGELAAARRTISVLMDRIERMEATAHTPNGLNRENLAVNQLVRQRTEDLQRLNQGLIAASIEHRRTERIIHEMQRIANLGGWELNVETGGIELTNRLVQNLGGACSGSPTIEWICSILAPADADRLRQRVTEAGGSSTSFDIEVQTLPVDGAERTLRIVGQPLVEEGVVSRVYGVIKDITKYKATEFHLAQAQRLESIGQLAAGVAHEINTPNQFVGDNVRFLKDNFEKLLSVIDACRGALNPQAPPRSWSDRQEQVRRLLAEVDFDFLREEIPLALHQSLEGLDRVAAIVRAMKDFSHPGTNQMEPADLNRSILSTIEVCRNRWKFVADLTTDLAADLPPVTCFVAEFNQVVLNLIVNAADAIAEMQGTGGSGKGAIHVTTRALDSGVEISVEDNGPGIPERVRARLFEPFFTTKPVGKGTGQGLSLSRNVVKKHGGELLFHPREGGGTRFVIRLPITADGPVVRDAA